MFRALKVRLNQIAHMKDIWATKVHISLPKAVSEVYQGNLQDCLQGASIQALQSR